MALVASTPPHTDDTDTRALKNTHTLAVLNSKRCTGLQAREILLARGVREKERETAREGDTD